MMRPINELHKLYHAKKVQWDDLNYEEQIALNEYWRFLKAREEHKRSPSSETERRAVKAQLRLQQLTSHDRSKFRAGLAPEQIALLEEAYRDEQQEIKRQYEGRPTTRAEADPPRTNGPPRPAESQPAPARPSGRPQGAPPPEDAPPPPPPSPEPPPQEAVPPQAAPRTRPPKFPNLAKVKFDWLTAIVAEKRLSDTRHRVGSFVALSYVDGDTGHTYAGYSTVAAQLGMARSTVQEAFADLIRLGYWTKVANHGPGKATRYALTFPPEVAARLQAKQEQRRNRKPPKGFKVIDGGKP
jgi:hypothetical protein